MKNDIAEQKWKQIPEEYKQLILSNVYCGKCGNTTIVDYTIEALRNDIGLKGKCKKCGKNVARLIEND